MAPQVRPGLTNPSFGTGPQQSVKVIRRQPAYSIRARDFASRKQAGCMAAINSCEPQQKETLGNKGASMYAEARLLLRDVSAARRLVRAPPWPNEEAIRARSIRLSEVTRDHSISRALAPVRNRYDSEQVPVNAIDRTKWKFAQRKSTVARIKRLPPNAARRTAEPRYA
jgi:hypothetical protein